VNRRHFRGSALSGIAVAACALATVLMAHDADAQAALSVPAGLPDWAFNIPDRVQPTVVKVEGIIRVPGSAKEYEAAKIAGNAEPSDWFPDEHPAAPRVVTGGQESFSRVAYAI